LHAIVRRVINAEVRRYLTASLEKQSSLNRRMLQVLKELVAENERLSREVAQFTHRDEEC
jgi:hypothetical protein